MAHSDFYEMDSAVVCSMAAEVEKALLVLQPDADITVDVIVRNAFVEVRVQSETHTVATDDLAVVVAEVFGVDLKKTTPVAQIGAWDAVVSFPKKEVEMLFARVARSVYTVQVAAVFAATLGIAYLYLFL